MNFHRIAVTGALSIVFIAACASDPGKKVSSAEADLSSDQQKAQSDERDKKAESTSKQESEHAEAASDKNSATTGAKKDVAVAQAALAQDRRDFDAKVKERLAKIDAKAKELKTKSAKLTGKKAADFKTHDSTFTTQRGDTTTKIASLDGTSNDAWAGAKTDVEQKLDYLDSAVAAMEKDF
jgi:hypothetical protein